MITKTYISRILWYQGIGFSTIIFFTWFVEIFDLPTVLSVNGTSFKWRESILESLIVLIVAIPVMHLTKRLLSRLYYLEGFLRVCAWCKKLENNDEWISIETFFQKKFQTESSHGICPECFEETRQKMNDSKTE